MLKVIGAILAVAAYIYFLVDVVRSPASEVRALPKSVWFLVVLLVPLIGGVVWSVLGRPRYGRAQRSLAPDDDPRFLRQLGDDAWRARMRKQRESEG